MTRNHQSTLTSSNIVPSMRTKPVTPAVLQLVNNGVAADDEDGDDAVVDAAGAVVEPRPAVVSEFFVLVVLVPFRLSGGNVLIVVEAEAGDVDEDPAPALALTLEARGREDENGPMAGNGKVAGSVVNKGSEVTDRPPGILLSISQRSSRSLSIVSWSSSVHEIAEH